MRSVIQSSIREIKKDIDKSLYSKDDVMDIIEDISSKLHLKKEVDFIRLASKIKKTLDSKAPSLVKNIEFDEVDMWGRPVQYMSWLELEAKPLLKLMKEDVSVWSNRISPGWEYINPLQEIKNKVESSHSSVFIKDDIIKLITDHLLIKEKNRNKDFSESIVWRISNALKNLGEDRPEMIEKYTINRKAENYGSIRHIKFHEGHVKDIVEEAYEHLNHSS
jgi:hypothetical protein